MILLITPSAQAQDCAQALSEATSETMQVAPTLREAATQLRTHEFSAVIFDQALLEAEPDESELVLQHTGTAMPVHVNFAISGVSRVVRELRAALRRRQSEGLVARQKAEQDLRNEVKNTVTAMLLSCEMVLQLPELSAAARAKIRSVHELAQGVCGKLGISKSD
jgi:hypothetical protein